MKQNRYHALTIFTSEILSKLATVNSMSMCNGGPTNNFITLLQAIYNIILYHIHVTLENVKV